MTVSCGATVAVLVFYFCWPLLCQALVHTGLAAERYSERADRYSGPGSPVHSWAFPGNDCTLAFGWGHWKGIALSYLHCKKFVMERRGTGSWVGEELMGVGEEGVSLRRLGSGVAGE